MPSSAFNLRLWFALGSLGTIAVICIAAAIWLSSYLTDNLLDRESQVSQEFLEAIVAVNGASMFADNGASPPYQSPELLDFAQHTLKIPGILRVNLYSTTRRILWSTEPQIVGQAFDKNDELDRALAGELVSTISYLNEDNKAEHVDLGNIDHFIEAYIPLRADAGNGPVTAVMEFYRLPLRLDDTIERGRQVIWIGAFVGAVLLFGTLYWIVQRGAQLIERQQKQMLRVEAFAAVGQMSGAVAHSLRNPMAAIRSSAELWQSQLPPESRVVADDIMRDVDRMDGYVRDLLAYARPETSNPRPVDPVRIVEAVVGRHARAAERSAVVISLSDRRNGDDRVVADEKLLEQALTTILTNAIEAMPGGGTVQVEVARGSRRGWISLAVSDTGSGIPAEVLKRVADAYFTTKPGGLGLGLVLARGIVEGLGGKLTITSAAGAGTKVVVELKAA